MSGKGNLGTRDPVNVKGACQIIGILKLPDRGLSNFHCSCSDAFAAKENK